MQSLNAPIILWLSIFPLISQYSSLSPPSIRPLLHSPISLSVNLADIHVSPLHRGRLCHENKCTNSYTLTHTHRKAVHKKKNSHIDTCSQSFIPNALTPHIHLENHRRYECTVKRTHLCLLRSLHTQNAFLTPHLPHPSLKYVKSMHNTNYNQYQGFETSNTIRDLFIVLAENKFTKNTTTDF